MIFSFGSLAASTPYLAGVLFLIVSLWIFAARDLNVLFTAYERERSTERVRQQIAESAGSMDGAQAPKKAKGMPSVDGAFIEADDFSAKRPSGGRG